MIKVILSLLLLFYWHLPASAQSNCPGKEVPYTAQIGGKTDSITVEALLQAGKVECTSKAFEITGFTMGFVSSGLGCYSELHCTSDSLSTVAMNHIRSLGPGSRIFLDCVQVKNKVGEAYVLKPSKLKICSKLPGQLTTK